MFRNFAGTFVSNSFNDEYENGSLAPASEEGTKVSWSLALAADFALH
jgi:hypothetical protein